MASLIQVVFACDDPQALAQFWAPALGYVLQPPPDGYETWDDFADDVGIPEVNRNDLAAVVDPEGHGPRFLFERWDGGVPNQRVHVDINLVGGEGSQLSDEERQEALESQRRRLEGLGARFHRFAEGMAGERWLEMFDPEGNWFCVQ